MLYILYVFLPMVYCTKFPHNRGDECGVKFRSKKIPIRGHLKDTKHCTLLNAHYTLYTVNFKIHAEYYTLHTENCALHIKHCTIHTEHKHIKHKKSKHCTLYTTHYM